MRGGAAGQRERSSVKAVRSRAVGGGALLARGVLLGRSVTGGALLRVTERRERLELGGRTRKRDGDGPATAATGPALSSTLPPLTLSINTHAHAHPSLQFVKYDPVVRRHVLFTETKLK